MVVFPYQSTNESVSGAVRQAISSLTPVAVAPLSIFDDVSDVVHKLPGSTPSLIANGIKDWTNNHFGQSIGEKEKRWLEASSFSKLGSRLQGLIRSLELNEEF